MFLLFVAIQATDQYRDEIVTNVEPIDLKQIKKKWHNAETSPELENNDWSRYINICALGVGGGPNNGF